MDLDKLNAIRVAISLSAVLLFGSIGIGTAAFLRRKKKKSLAYLVLFTTFYVYLVTVLYYTLFQYQSLLLLQHFAPDLRLSGQAAGENMNLIPLVTLTPAHVKTSLLN